MTELKLIVAPHEANKAVERAIEALGLTMTMDGTLKSIPGSRHLHLKLGKRPGTLEVTIQAQTGEVRILYHENRAGDGWVVDCAARFVMFCEAEASE